MKNKFTNLLIAAVASSAISGAAAQNVSLNMIVLNAGVVPVSGSGTLQATINATPGTGGQSNAVAAGKINLQISVPSTLLISTTQNNIPPGWTIRNNNGSVINLCNSSSTIAVNTAVNILLDLEGVSATTGAPTISGQLSFRTNCTAPGSLAGDNPSDNTGQAGFIVTGTVPVKISDFTAAVTDCRPVLNWVTESEINLDRFEIEKSNSRQQNWETVDIVEAKGNNRAEKNKYRFLDISTNNSDEVFYRLKMTDNDGRYSYSPVVSVSLNCNTVRVLVFPNPVKNGEINILLSGSNKTVTAALMSAAGQLLSTTIVQNGSAKISVAALSKGIYFLKIINSSGVNETVKKIIVE